MNDLLNITEARKSYFRKRGFNVHAVWGHEINFQDNEYLKRRFVEVRRLREKTAFPMREGLAGGRTENFMLKYECASDERLRYVDFTSLYPFVLKNKRFPLGHPEKHTEDLDPATYPSKHFFGIIYCRIIAPRKLYLPLLGVKHNGKLIFGLCNACIKDMCQGDCNHNEEERALDFMWTTVEIDKALELGYKMLEIFCVLHYKDNDSQLFKPYIDLFLKLKQEKSGKPEEVQSAEDMAQYISSYKEREGIELDPQAIERNEGLRLIAKIMLNSLWGKLVQRPNMPQTDVIHDFHALSALISDPAKDVIGTSILNDQTVIASWKYKDDKDAVQGNTSPVTACFVTAYARLELYHLMEQVERVRPHRVCYADTDSLIFVEKNGDPEVRLGNFLGDLTDEVEAGFKCIRGVFAGPKSYCLEMQRGNETRSIMKIKGLSLNYTSMKQITIDAVEKLVCEHVQHQNTGIQDRQISVSQTQFRAKSKASQILFTHRFEKLFRVTSNKRVTRGYESYPYGFDFS